LFTINHLLSMCDDELDHKLSQQARHAPASVTRSFEPATQLSIPSAPRCTASGWPGFCFCWAAWDLCGCMRVCVCACVFDVWVRGRVRVWCMSVRVRVCVCARVCVHQTGCEGLTIVSATRVACTAGAGHRRARTPLAQMPRALRWPPPPL